MFALTERAPGTVSCDPNTNTKVMGTSQLLPFAATVLPLVFIAVCRRVWDGGLPGGDCDSIWRRQRTRTPHAREAFWGHPCACGRTSGAALSAKAVRRNAVRVRGVRGLSPASTGRRRSGQIFASTFALDDRFTAANSRRALARLGQLLPVAAR